MGTMFLKTSCSRAGQGAAVNHDDAEDRRAAATKLQEGAPLGAWAGRGRTSGRFTPIREMPCAALPVPYAAPTFEKTRPLAAPCT